MHDFIALCSALTFALICVKCATGSPGGYSHVEFSIYPPEDSKNRDKIVVDYSVRHPDNKPYSGRSVFYCFVGNFSIFTKYVYIDNYVSHACGK